MPLFAVLVLVREEVSALPGFYKRAQWLIKNRPDLASRVYLQCIVFTNITINSTTSTTTTTIASPISF